MSGILRSLEQQAARARKNVVIRCPSKGKSSNYDYYYRCSLLGLGDDLRIGSHWVPTLKLVTSENKKTYYRMGKTAWTPVGGVYDVALISPMEGELLGHAPFGSLGNWPSPAKQPAPAPDAARYSPPTVNRGGGAAASGSASTPTTSRATRNTGPKVMSRLTGITNSPPLSQNPNFINSQGGTTRVGYIDLVPTTEAQAALHEVFGETPGTADNSIGHEEPPAPLTVGNNHEEGPIINIIPPTQSPMTAGPSHEETPQIVIIPPTQSPRTAGPSHEETPRIATPPQAQNPPTAARSHEDLSCPSPSLEIPPQKSPTRPNALALVIAHETPVQGIVPQSETGDDEETEDDPGNRNLEHLVEALNEETNAAPFFSWVSLIPPDDPTVTVLLEPQTLKIGRLLAEVSNIQAAKIRHVNELADGRPPVIPLARAFQCPSMGRVATEELVNAWNKAMLNCAQEMSLALIKEEERAEKEIRAQLTSDALAWNFTQEESHAVKLIRDARVLKQHPYKHNPDPLVFFELTGTGDQRKITPHVSATRANTSRHKIPGKAKGAKATKAEVTGAKATNTNKKPEDTVPAPKKPTKKKSPQNKGKGKNLAPPLPIQNDGSGQQGKKKSRTKSKGGARPNPGQQVRRGSVSFITEVPAKAPQPVPPTVVTEVTQTVTPQLAPAATVTEPAVNGTQTVVTINVPTGGPQPAPAATMAPRQTPKSGPGSDPTRPKAPAPKNNGNMNQRGGSGRLPGNQTNQTAPAPSKNYQRNGTGQQYQQRPQQNPGNGSYRSNWRSAPNPPPLVQNLPSYPPRLPPPWGHTDWSNGYQYHRVDYEEPRWRPLRYVERDGPDQNRCGWMNPFRK